MSQRICPVSRRQAIIGLLSMASLPAIASGCKTASSDNLKIWSMWSGDESKFFTETLKAFEHAHPGIHCENLGSVTDEKSVRAIVAGAPPDLLTLKDPLFLGTLAVNGALEPLDDFLEMAGLTEDDYVPGSLSQCKINGKLYAVPYLIDVIALLINKRVFREAGLNPDNPPTTIEALEDICRRLTQRGPDGRLTRIGLRPPDPLTYLIPSGAHWVGSDGQQITANTPENIAALDAYIRLMKAQGGNEAVEAFQAGFQNEQGSFNPFYLGQTAMIYSGQWNSFWIATYSLTTEIAVHPLPVLQSDSRRAGGAYLGGNLFCIPKGSRNKELALKFLLWSQTLKGQETFAQQMKGVPNIKKALQNPGLRTGAAWKPMYSEFLDLAASPSNQHFPPLQVAAEYQSEIINAVDSVRYGNGSSVDVLAGVQSRMEHAMRSYQKAGR